MYVCLVADACISRMSIMIAMVESGQLKISDCTLKAHRERRCVHVRSQRFIRGEMCLLYVYGILRCPHLVRSQRFIWGGDNRF